MKIKHWKKITIFSMLILGLLTVFFVSARLNSKASSSAIRIQINGETYGPSDVYKIQDKITTVTIQSDSPVYASDSAYQINWILSSPGILEEQVTPLGKMSKNFEAKGVGEVTLLVQVTLDGETVSNTSCRINVGFAIDRTSNGNAKFTKIFKTDTERSLILRANNLNQNADPSDDIIDIILNPIFTAPGVRFESSNADVITSTTDGRCKAIGAGTAIITASYSVLSGGVTTVYTDTIKVFVLPKVRQNTANNYDANITISADDESPIYVDAGFVNRPSQVLGDKIEWFIEKKRPGSDVYDPVSRSSNPNSNLATLIPENATSNKYIIDAKAGQYKISFYTKGTYSSSVSNYDDGFTTFASEPAAIVNVTIYAKFSDKNISLVVGDSYNILDAFNIDLETYNRIFTPTYTSAIDDEYINFTNGLINFTSSGNAVVSLEIKNTPGIREEAQSYYNGILPPSPTRFFINITVIEGFALSQSSATMYLNAEMDLRINTTYEGGKLEWSSSDTTYATVSTNGRVRALRVTETNRPVTITAKYTMADGQIKTATCRIVIVSTITNLTLSTTEAYLPVGDVRTITASFTPANSTASLIWVSSDPNIVDMQVSSDRRSVVVTGKEVGTTVILVMNERNMVYTSCKIVVSNVVNSITLNNTTLSAKLNQEFVRLRAITTPSNAAAVLLWGSSNTSVATVDENGLVTLVSAGTTIISVKPAYNPNYIQAQCVLTVTEPSRGITLSKATTTIEVSKTETIEYVLNPTNATTTVSWKSLDTTIATVNSRGVVTAVAPGKTHIIATTSEGYSAMCSIVVTQAASGIKLDVYDLTLGVGDVYHVLAMPTPTGSTETNLTWTSKDPKIATVTDSGKVTGVSAGQTIILIKTKSGKVEYLYVTVKENLKGMKLNYSTRTVTKNSTFTLKPEFTPASPTNKKVTWRSSNTKVASVSNTGVVKGLQGGTAIIYCTTEDGGYVATCIVTVRELATSITLNKSSYRIGIGKSYQLKAVVKSNTATKQVLRWTSSNTSVATVNSKGVITAKRMGKCTIRVKATDGSGAQDTCTIYVVRAATSIRLDKVVTTVVVGRSVKLNATIRPTNATFKTPTWSSSNKDVALVDSTGRVTGIKAGVTTIKALTKDNSNKAAYCIVNVIDEVSSSGVIVSTKDMTLIKGQTGTVSYSIQPSNSTDKVTFASDNRAVATVTNTGKIKAWKSGVATITITTSSGKQAVVNVTVVGLNKTSIKMYQYDSETIWVEGATKVTWYSTNPGIATVDKNGKIIARKAGTTTIFAVVNGIKLQCTVKVYNIR